LIDFGALESADDSDSCVLKLIISCDDVIEDFLFFAVHKPEWKALNPFLVSNLNHQETLIVMSEVERNSFDAWRNFFRN
jgi:hypothetical protein